MTVLETIFWGFILISALVVIHEFGHYAAARLFKVRVSEFMVGLPGPSVTLFKAGGTRFGFTALPFGGYAAIAGMEPGPEDPQLAEALAYVYRHGSTDVVHLGAYLDAHVAVEAVASTAVPDDRDAGPGDSEEDAPSADVHARELLQTLESWAAIERDDSPEAKQAARRARQEGREVPVRYVAAADPVAGLETGRAREVADPASLLDEMRKGTYHALSFPKRILVLFAGPLMNLITAVLVLLIVLSAHGLYRASDTNAIGSVVDGGAAQAVGMQADDVVTGIDGEPVGSWTDISAILANLGPDQTVTVTWTRGGEPMQADIVLSDTDGRATLGVYASYELYHYPIGEALVTTFSYIGTVAVAILNLFNPFQVQQVLSQSSSIVGVAVIAQQAAAEGVASFAVLVAAVSTSLGLMNLLPIPPLDGGKIVIEVVQAIRRREVSLTAQSRMAMVGVILFGALFIYTLAQDIGRIATGSM